MIYQYTLKNLQDSYGFRQVTPLAYKDVSKVYSVQDNARRLILKLQKDMDGFRRETIALDCLNRKGLSVPELVFCGTDQGDSGTIGYLAETYIPGTTLREAFDRLGEHEKSKVLSDAGTLLGGINTALDLSELKESNLWRYAYDPDIEFEDYRWIMTYQSKILKWMDRLTRHCDPDTAGLLERCSQKILRAIVGMEPDGKLSLLHRDFGFRNIMIQDGSLTGVIDFEYAIPGDPYFDLSKIVFNDLDFESDVELRNAFLCGWSQATGEEVKWNRLWLYLAIQGLGAIQWVDRQPREIQDSNQDYKEKGMKILLRSCEEI